MNESELSDAAAFRDWVRRTAARIEADVVPDDRLAEMMARILSAGSVGLSGESHAFEQALERTGTEVFVAVREWVGRMNPAAVQAKRAADLYGLYVFDGLGEQDSIQTDDGPRRHLRLLGDEQSESPQPGFRLHESRVMDLLMGEQLYGDPGLAVRELYQNALDACRYRVARYEYLSRTSEDDWRYTPEITFTHGQDEMGRTYLECADNGVGMDEQDLRELFSRAGARFVESQNYGLELATWQKCEPPVEHVPNSRFGIGVLSYFMLADRIEVTTCRMNRFGKSGPVLQLGIDGPGTYRITRVRDHGEPGTKVRLLLREPSTQDGHRGWGPSYLAGSLDRVLGVAEFPTAFHYEDSRMVWNPGELRPSQSLDRRARGVRASGWTVPCLQGRVVWCEEGGALLLDGLLVEPHSGSRILEGSSHGTLSGVVVNLPATPALDLSVDRHVVVTDVSDDVEGLLASAAAELVDRQRELVTGRWLSDLDWQCPAVARVVRSALAHATETGGDQTAPLQRKDD